MRHFSFFLILILHYWFDRKSTDERPKSTIFTDDDGEILLFLSVNGANYSPMSRPTPTQSLAIIAAKKIVWIRIYSKNNPNEFSRFFFNFIKKLLDFFGFFHSSIFLK